MFYAGNFSGSDDNPEKIGPSKTLQILMLFAHKFLYPEFYSDYDITEEHYEKLLVLLEEKINHELDKVEQEREDDVDDDMKSHVEEQINCLMDSGELFLEAIEEMRLYLERDDDEKGKENLLRGIEIARRADKKLIRSIEIFEELRETH
ncbi:MAG: hypothetical protein ABRQ39_07355 [Candidatus Eremiobacterota bacterium]